MICKYCKKEIEDDSVFCGYCGTQLINDDIIEETDNKIESKAQNIQQKNIGIIGDVVRK